MNSAYFIPTNYTDAGRLFGLFEPRNALEAVVLGIPILFFCVYFLPLDLTAKIMATLFLLVPVCGFALIGLCDDSLTRYLWSWWRWRHAKSVMTFRGEVNQRGFERSYLRGRSRRA